MSPITRICSKSILFLFIALVSANDNLCPKKCVCRKINQKNEIKMRCGESVVIKSLEEIELLNIAGDVVQFNLSNNSMDTFLPKVQMISLQKLDLSKNRIAYLQRNQFVELPNLRRLDISNNIIRIIDPLAFNKLENLEKLRLNQNQITAISIGTFNPLISLKQLDISNNPLNCDCSLLWLLDFTQKHSIKLTSNPKCQTPQTFKGLLLRKLKIGQDIHCKSPALNSGFPIIEMKPDANQVVFEGDSLNLQCTAPSISDSFESELKWTWLDSDPKNHFADIVIEDHFLQSGGLVASNLKISKLKKNHTGIWSCLLISMQGNHSKGITIVVISDETEYCPITVTSNNKGTYTWPRTIVNYTASVPCESTNLNYDLTFQKASYFCSEEGQWTDLNTTTCSYISETTKILEQFSKVNSSIIESARHFRNYTSSVKHFKDVMDIVFSVETMNNYLKFLTVNQVGGVLMDVADNLMRLDKAYLRQAEYEFGSCGKLVQIVEKLSGSSSAALLHKSNIAIEMFPVKRNAFTNLRCTWYTDLENVPSRLFYCVADSQTETTELPGKEIEASITIPETLFEQLEEQNIELKEKIYNILVSMFSSNKLFPIDREREVHYDVTSAVIGAKLIGITVTNLTDPVYVLLKTAQYTSGESIPIPVWWNNDTSSWTTDGCEFSHEYQNHVVFYCHNFGYYGLLQDISNMKRNLVGEKFKPSHPAIYVGSFILFTSLLTVIMTYLLCYNTIQMPKKTKHGLINLWMSICFLCFMYVFGIYQTEDLRICQIVGILLHYSTLSSLLWMCVGVNCMYKRLSKNDVMELQDDELPSDQPIKKPILGLYFVGWGIPIIICGITAAINITEYASPTYCFLRIGPPLSALYIPVAILLIFFVIFCLLIRCAVYNLDANGHLSEGTQATENVDLDLLEPNFQESRSVLSQSSKTASSEVEDPEHAPSAQLKAYIIFLTLYLLAWVCCALATVEPYGLVSFESDIFSIGYAVFSAVLSAFTIFFYCVARSDVRSEWILIGRCFKRKQCFRSRNVSDAAQNLPQIQIQNVAVPVVAELPTNSRSSSRSSSRTKSNSHTSNILKGAVDLNGPNFNEVPEAKINNVNLIVLHRQQYRSSVIPNIIENPTNADVFYNPHQSIVARKFFKRQKRHQMKRNNLVTRPRDSDTGSVISKIKDNSSVDHSIFGTSSKVNNTNIHVEHTHKSLQKQRNPNIFSDSADDYDRVDVPVQNLVDRLRRKELSKNKSRKKSNVPSKSPSIENNMRSVSQQCTLEYSSENVSDSILDKTSPDNDKLDGVSKVDDGTKSPETAPRIFINPAHDLPHSQKRVQSRASSVSVSDLDELYQQIRRGPKQKLVNNFSLTRNSPCFSDSDITSYVTTDQKEQYASRSNMSDNVETTV